MFEEISFSAAFLAGLLSFFSPCVFPLVPSYFTFITGSSLEELTEARSVVVRRKIIVATFAFVLGFSAVFIILGASASYLSSLLMAYQSYLRVGGGVLIIVLGLHMMGAFRIRVLDIEKRLHLKKKPLHFLGTFFIGMAFGAGWSPCIGPLLGSILILAGNQETIARGIWLLAVYSIGLALPFVILSVCINFLINFIYSTAKTIRYIHMVAGILLIITGLLLIADRLRLLAVWG